MKYRSSYITLKNLKIHAFHGVGEQESIVGNEFIINIKLEVDLVDAAISDSVTDTVSYADIFVAIQDEMKTPSKLLEHVAYRIIKRIFRDFKKVKSIELSLDKNVPPMGADIDTAGVILSYMRDE